VERLLRKASRSNPNLKAVEDMITSTTSVTTSKLNLRRYLMEALEILEADGQLAGEGDNWHSLDELYNYRMAYHAYAVKSWQDNNFRVVKSWRHHDGEDLRLDNLFVVSANLPTGQVTNHYRANHWGKFECPEVARAPEWDGHTPAVALDRLIKAIPMTGSVKQNAAGFPSGPQRHRQGKSPVIVPPRPKMHAPDPEFWAADPNTDPNGFMLSTGEDGR
jgi:hypothetical protein